jgi:hypothetical protein
MDFQYNLISRNGILLIGYDVENLCIDFKCKRVNQCFAYFTRQITILTWILSRRPGIIPCIRKRSSFENIGMLAGAICFMSETYLSEYQVFVSVDLKYKERCLHVNRFQWLSSYMHNFVNNC